MSKTIIAIVGETCSGKDSLVNRFLQSESGDEFVTVCSHTTRPKRDNETNGVEHYFDSEEEFHKIMEENPEDILAYTKIVKNDGTSEGYEYFALLSDLSDEHPNIYIIDPKGIEYLEEKFGSKINLVTVYIYAGYQTRLERAKTGRSDFETEFNKRVENEHDQFDEFRIRGRYDKVIINENCTFDQAYQLFLKTLMDIKSIY